jgi:hypothetical protein
MNELEVFDDFVVEDIIPKDIEKQLLIQHFEAMDKLCSTLIEIGSKPVYNSGGIVSDADTAKLVNAVADACVKYQDYVIYCRENMEM